MYLIDFRRKKLGCYNANISSMMSENSHAGKEESKMINSGGLMRQLFLFVFASKSFQLKKKKDS